jgi:uncharacterized LabA/DUF88 family protein
MIALSVDIANLYYCVGKRFQSRKLDYAKLRDRVAQFGQLYRCMAYGVQMGNEADGFIGCIKKLGYDTKYKKIKMTDETEKKVIRKADSGVEMSLDIVQVIDRVDTVVLSSSDEDLVDLVRFIKSKGVRCVILASGIPQSLREVCDFYVEITEDLLEEKIARAA